MKVKARHVVAAIVAGAALIITSVGVASVVVTSVNLTPGEQAQVSCTNGSLQGVGGNPYVVNCNSTTTAPPVQFSLVGSVVSTNGTSSAVTNTTVGDVRVVTLASTTSTATLTASGGGVTTWNYFGPTFKEVQVPGSERLAWGVITSAGSKTLSGAGAGLYEISSAEFNAGTGATYSQDGTLGTASGNTTTVAWKSVQPSGPDELYWGYAVVSNVSSPGSTAGFNYVTSFYQNPIVYSDNAPGPAAPTAVANPAGWDAIDGLLIATPPGGTTTTTGSTTSTTAGTTTSTTVAPTTTTTASSTTTTVAPTTTVPPTTTTTAANNTCTNPNFTDTTGANGQQYGNYYVFNNAWGLSHPLPTSGVGSEKLAACNYNSWNLTADMQAGNTAVLTYPNVQETYNSVPISSLSSLTSDYAMTSPTGTGDWEDAYDMWINGITGAGSNEVMIWTDNHGQTPAGNNVGSFTSGGITYAVYATSNNSYIAFVPPTNSNSGTVNILGFYQYLINQGRLAANSVVDQIDYGIEICSTNSTPQTWNLTNFDINSTTGGTTTTSAATTSTTVAPTTSTTAPATTTTASGNNTAPTSPPVIVCGNTSLLAGPSTPPAGAVTVPAGDDTVNADSDGSLIYLNYEISPNTIYYFEPGVHTLGTGNFNSIEPMNGDTFIGAPGAIINGQSDNQDLFYGNATNVTIENLTIENFATPNGQDAVNHDDASNWTVEYNTIEGTNSGGPSTSKPGGAGLGGGANNTVEYNCLTNNGEYGLNAGYNNSTYSYNEISDNGAADYPDNDCGCSGGLKFWDASDITFTDNYVHNNYNVGFWADTDNEGFIVQGNYISDNWGQGIIYEISYNANIADNTFIANGWGSGSTCEGCGNITGSAIYIAGSGGLAGTGSYSDGVLTVANNVFTDNWDGVTVYQNADRTCGSGANSSTGYCTNNNPSVFTTTSCANNYPNSTGPNQNPDYYDGCQWKATNIAVTDNTFNFNSSNIYNNTYGLSYPTTDGAWNPTDCPANVNLTDTSNTNSSWCGYDGMYGFDGSLPPVGGTMVVSNAIMNLTNSNGEAPDNNHWTGNTYNGATEFQAYDQGVANANGQPCTVNLSQWQSVWGQD